MTIIVDTDAGVCGFLTKVHASSEDGQYVSYFLPQCHSSGEGLTPASPYPMFRHMAKYKNNLVDVARVGLALSDPGRLRMLMALQGRSLCVCEMTELMGLAPSTVSKHLSVLKDAGLIKESKRGRWVYHELCCDDCECQPVLGWLRQQLGRDQQIALDKAKLKSILQLSPEELCCK